MAFKPVKDGKPVKDFFILVKLSKVTFTFLSRKNENICYEKELFALYMFLKKI